MEPRRKLLFISPCTPDPQGTGREQRAFAFLSAYSKFMEIELWFTPTHDNPELIRIEKLTRLCASITSFYPLVINDPKSRLRERLIRSLSTADAVHVLRQPQMVAAIGHRLIVWDVDEFPWPVSRQPSTEEERQLSDLYSRSFGKCRKVFVSSHLERQSAPFDPVEVIPNVAVDPGLDAADLSEKASTLLFVGNLNHPPNREGLKIFNDSILPDLARDIPDVVVNVVGRSPITDRGWAAVDELRSTGRYAFDFDVPSCTPHYVRAAASIVPIFSGGGTRIKILESFAHRCAVISTKEGCEGLDVAHRTHLLIGDGRIAFASACAELIHSPALRRELTETAYRFFECNHCQKVVDRLLVAVFQGLG